MIISYSLSIHYIQELTEFYRVLRPVIVQLKRIRNSVPIFGLKFEVNVANVSHLLSYLYLRNLILENAN